MSDPNAHNENPSTPGTPEQPAYPAYPTPEANQQPPAGYGQPAPGYQQQPVYGDPASAAYPAQQPYGYGLPPTVPGKTLGIVGFVLAFLGPLSLVGLVISIVAVVQSRRAGAKNGLGVAGIIISVVVLALTAITIAVGVYFLFNFQDVICAEYGPGLVEFEGGQSIMCE